MRFTQATLAAFIAATAEARTFAVLRFNGKGLTTGRMDPIVNPGVPSGHVHNIQGGNAFKLSMTDDDPSSSTCTTAKIANDFSNYWTPTLFFKDPSSGQLESVEMFYMNVYYFFENDNDKVHAFPKGLRMFVGNPNARTPPGTSDNILDTSRGTPQPIQWTCPRSNNNARLYPANSDGMHGVGMQDSQNTGAGVGFPDKECDGYASPLRADIHFPSCYDTSKDVRDYKNNMQWPQNNKCPAGTIRVPHLFFEVYWNTLDFQDRWTKGQGESPWVLSNGDKTGYSLHADFINGWDEKTLQTIIDTCDAGSSGMDKCPNIPGGLNTNNACTVPNLVPETVMGVMSSLPGGAKVGDWGEAAAPAPSQSQQPASSAAPAPAPSSTTKASTPVITTKADTPSSVAQAPSSNAPAPNPSTTLQTSTRVAGQTSDAPEPTTAPEATDAPTPTAGETIVTEYVSETTLVYTTLTLAPGATNVPEAISGYSYKGCFSDSVSARVLTGLKFANIGHKQVTSTKCVDYCADRGFSIAGTEFGGQCFCGNELVGSSKIDESACKLPCEGDNSEICGGGLALSVFEKTTEAKKRSSHKARRHVHRHAIRGASH